MPLPSKRDPDELRHRLAHWLAARLPEGAAPELRGLGVPAGTGMSSETLLFSARWREAGEARSGRFVVRMQPEMSDFPVFPSYDLALQARCLDVVRTHTDVPVPRVVWFEPDAAPLGAPFFVMERLDGRAPPDLPPYVFGSWLSEASPADRARLERASLGVLAKLHRLTPERADLAFLDRPQHGKAALDQHLAYQRWYYEWARGGVDYPTIERTFDWLEKQRPADPGPTVLNWGDARIGNILYRDFTPVAVLDWEMAALGPAGVDVAWMVFMHDFFADLAARAGLAPIVGFLERRAAVACYEELSGQRVRDFEYWQVFAALRYAVISTRTMLRAVAYGQAERPADPEDVIMIRHLLVPMLSGDYWS